MRSLAWGTAAVTTAACLAAAALWMAGPGAEPSPGSGSGSGSGSAGADGSAVPEISWNGGDIVLDAPAAEPPPPADAGVDADPGAGTGGPTQPAPTQPAAVPTAGAQQGTRVAAE